MSCAQSEGVGDIRTSALGLRTCHRCGLGHRFLGLLMVAGQTPYSKVSEAPDLEMTSGLLAESKPSHLSGHQMAMQRSHPAKFLLAHPHGDRQGNPCQKPNRLSLPVQSRGDNWCLDFLV